jgi:DNA mismatch endonuclease (patch repair protein)
MLPSFRGLKPASERASRAKRANRRTETQHEILLRRELWRRGLRYRKNVSGLPGKPDIVFTGARVAVFCDGDFWHGREWGLLSAKLGKGTNSAYWIAKIGANLERDQRTTKLLQRAGWYVIRLWETDIKRDPLASATQIAGVVRARHKPSVRKQSARHPVGGLL